VPFDAIGLASLAVAAVALVVALMALRRSDRNTSAGTLVTLYEAFRQAWNRFLNAESEDGYEFAELMNLVEIGCAVHLDGSVHGVSRELLEEYLCETVSLIESDAAARGHISRLKSKPTTFKYLRKFAATMKTQGRSSEIEAMIAPPGPAYAAALPTDQGSG